jgi:hypothetical protein
MLSARNTAEEATFCLLANNLYRVQDFYLGDWKSIMEEGLWIFRGCTLMLEKYDGLTIIQSVVPSKVQAWIQIHKIPPLFRTQRILKQLAS